MQLGRIVWVLFGVFSGISTAAAADLLDVFRLSEQHDPELQAAIYRFEAAREAVPQAKAKLFPDLTLSYEHLETDQEIKSSDNAVFGSGQTDFPTKTFGLVLTQTIFRFGDWQALKQSHARVAQAIADLEAARQDHILRVSQIYLGVLASEDDLDFASAELAAVESQLELATRRRESGLATRTDEYDARARFALVHSNEIEARNRLDDARQALMVTTGELITGLDSLAESIPLDTPDPANPEIWVDQSIRQNLGLEARRQAEIVAGREVRRQRGGHYPTLDLVARLDDRDTDGSLFGGGSEVETADISLQFNVPLFKGGGTRSRVRQASFEHMQARQELRLEMLEVTRAARSAYLGVISAVNRVNALAESVAAQQNALAAKRREFQSGINTALHVLDAERDLYLIKRDYAQARYDYLLNMLRLKSSAGSLAVTDLERINRMLTTGD